MAAFSKIEIYFGCWVKRSASGNFIIFIINHIYYNHQVFLETIIRSGSYVVTSNDVFNEVQTIQPAAFLLYSTFIKEINFKRFFFCFIDYLLIDAHIM